MPIFCAPSYYGPVPGHCFSQVVFWGMWLLWPLLLALGVFAWRRRTRWNGWDWGAWTIAVCAVAVPLDMRFIERQWIVERHTVIDLGFAARIAVISDIHLGLFKDEAFAARVVERLNAIDVDVVLFAGDWTYDPTRPIAELVAPFAKLRHPMLSVPGNHDEQQPGPLLVKPLRDALIGVGIVPVEYTHHRLATFTVVGLGDHWAGKDGIGPLNAAPRDQPVIVLAHQPDTVMRFTGNMAALAVTGHTHGGQVRFPFVGAVVNASKNPFDRGLHTWTPIPTFVTSGLGEVGLPIRLLNPPVIDVLTVR
jgi:uncharacterized protein